MAAEITRWRCLARRDKGRVLMPLATDREDLRLNRIWLRIEPRFDFDTIIDRFSFPGDYVDLIHGVSRNPDFDNAFYFPISGDIPAYLFTGSYSKQTPEWSGVGKSMADIMGGLAKSAGNILNKIGNLEAVKIGGKSMLGRLGGLATGAGEFLHLFTGDIDSPKIWDRSEVAPVTLESTVAFENEYEQKYYKAAEILLTLMTMPVTTGEFDNVARIGKLLNTSSEGPIRKYKIFTMGEPLSDCDIDIVVGKQQRDLKALYDVVTVDASATSGSLNLFAMRECFLAAFSLSYGADSAAGFDERGIPRLLKYSFTLDPKSLQSIIDGYADILNFNKHTQLSDVPIGVLPGYAMPATVDDIPEGPFNGMMLAYAGRQVRFAAGMTIRSILNNILFGSVSAAAAAYVGQRVINSVTPVRVLVGAGGNSTLLPAGYAGYIKEAGHNIAKTSQSSPLAVTTGAAAIAAGALL